MDDLKVTGVLRYEVSVKCPHCNGFLNLDQAPYPEEDPFDILGMMLFGSPNVPAQWTNLNLRYKCNHCKKDFILEKIEY